MKLFLASIRVRPSISSTASSYFTMGYCTFSFVIITSALPLSCVCGSSSSSISNTSASSPPSVSYSIVSSALPCRLLSIFRSRSYLRRFCSTDSRRSLRSVLISPLPSSSRSLTACMAPSTPYSRPEQRFTLLHAYLACDPTAQRTSLENKRWHISLITTGLTPRHLSRATIHSDMMAR